ncbi:MAG TPA: hypothetical protein VGM11_04915 [Acidobacteriaceae bacterium]
MLCAASAALLLAGRALPARAEVSLLLEQPYGGLGVVNPTGHAALYFDHICAATPIELRPCRPGELGAVISRYDGIDHRDWVAIPLVAYLYAVESPADIPTTMNRAEEVRLRDQYRRRELESVAPDLPDGGTPGGNWYELVGSAYDRAIYGFSVATTAEQDASLMAMFNDRRNVERYNGAFRNCADFARTTINHIYPHAIRRNFIADFGLTTPKQVARGLSHYAHKHPGVDFHVFRVPQVPGSIWRSYGIQGVTESLIKRYGVPLVVLSPVATGVVFVAYLGHGRFDMPRDAPVLDLRQRALNVDTTTTAEAATQAAPAMLPLPTPDGIAMRSGPPSDLFAPGAPAAALEAPGQPASEQSPPALLAYPTYE